MKLATSIGTQIRHHHRRSALQPGRTDGGENEYRSCQREAEEEEETTEDTINRIMEARKMLPNASYFAFTATPKNKTLEMFGDPCPAGDK